MNWTLKVMKSFFSMRKLNFLFGVVLAATVLTSCNKEKEVESISLDKPTLTLEIGEWQILTATVLPAGAKDKSVIWTSSNPTVATVIDGIVTAITMGKTTVIAKAGNYTATCEVTVVSGLVGTTWIGKDNYERQCTLHFTSETNCTLYRDDETVPGTYSVVNYPNISVTVGTWYPLSGGIVNNTMTLVNMAGYRMTLTKQ